ncbi:MAG: DUF342 domain-containing protein [Lachnotalea sp.]
MADKTSDKTYVRISNDEMEAYLYLAVPEDGHEYSSSELYELLSQNRVLYGINEMEIDEIADKRIYYREILIAQGIRQTDGVEGKYTYNFNTNPSGKPTIREDGTVDYWSVFAVQTILEGDIIAVYTPSTAGTQGRTVTDKIIEGKRGKDLLPLKGKGFISEDNITYTSLLDGKIEFQNNRIHITNLLEIKEDLDFNNGKIDFRGDVVIHGNVESGSHIKSGGSVTIDGNVESITIISGKDVILRKGLQGGGKASIQAGGNIFAKFIEGANVEAKGSIQADVLMNSVVIAGDGIEISGKKATIIGGTVMAISRIDVPIAGNEAETKTQLSVGIDDELKERIIKLKSVSEIIDDMIKEINTELDELERKKDEGPLFARSQAKDRIMELLRKKIKYISDKAEFSKELGELEEKTCRAKNACIVVSKYTYPGVTIKTNSASIVIEEKQVAMKYRYEGGEVSLINMDPIA